ncbi:MAG: LPS-assembly protein LptD [Desulfuromonas sp.]|nr:LPS-assembly protein LptD [Desulfuromonas sp.]
MMWNKSQVKHWGIGSVIGMSMLLVCLSTTSWASALEQSDQPVSLQADVLDYDQPTATYTAEGQVDLQQGTTQLFADKVRYNTLTGDAEAAGHVELHDVDGQLCGEQMQVNIKTGVGVAERAHGFVAAYNFHLSGDEISKLGESSYRIRNGFFTTCDGEPPAWKFGARDLNVTIGGYAKAKHVKFYLHDVPVLYLPYLAYPVKPDRESGFLLPGFGVSRERGTQISLAYYQVLARNMDATLFVDYFSDMGIGTGLEYRYIFGDDNEGIANLYYISTHGDSSYPDLDDRFAYRWDHLGTSPGNVRFSADVEYVSDRDYFEDFGDVAEEYDKDEVESTIALSKQWGNLNLTGELLYTKDLDLGADNDKTLQRLPEIQLDYSRTRLGDSPFYVKFDSTSTYFWRREGLKGERIDLRPAVSAIFQPGMMLEVEPEFGFRERLYWTSDEGPGFEHAENYDFSTRFSTRFARVFNLANKTGLTKLKHSIEPEVTYLYTPNNKQADLPYFDSADRVDNANEVEYALINRLVGRFDQETGAADYRELVYFKLSQTHDFWLSRRDREEKKQQDRFSDIRAELIVRPTARWFVDLDSEYDPHRNELTKFTAESGARYSDDKGFSASYRYQEDDSEYLATTINLDWIRPLYVTYEYRYDLVETHRLENVVELEYRAQCWSVFLSYRDRLEDNEIMLTFSLGGLGAIGHVGSSLSSE